MQADILIVTVTKAESQAVVGAFQKATGQAPKNIPIGNKIYRDLGTINGATVFMVRSEMGAGGLGAAQQTVSKGIEDLLPLAVIMVGIAFGVDEKKQAIGDILVSQRLMLYDSQRVGTDSSGKSRINIRGDRATASPWLLDRFRIADENWDDKNGKVRFGLILSGEKLVDNLEFRQEVLELEPEAVGGEMEGAGLYSAAQGSKTDWILVKGICDWADGKKETNRDERQRLAAHNAASFVLHVLNHVPLRRIPDIRRTQMSLLAPDFLALASNPTIRRQPRSNLPTQPYFFGRKKELKTIKDVLSPKLRSWGALIDGPGGIGKTALAIHAAHLAPVRHFPIKIFLSAKRRELTPAGEQPLHDFMIPDYMALLSELARDLGAEQISRMPPSKRANAVRRALENQNALLVIDNVEIFAEKERIRLYQFLARLPDGCKSIVTSRRRSDIDARVVRLDRLGLKESLCLMEELATTNRPLARSGRKERSDLYEITQGNPLLIKWVVGQLGRVGSNCLTIRDAYQFLKCAPKHNDPLEYIFGDLLDTFTPSETAVLAALVHFTLPAKAEWIAEIAQVARPAAQTALEDLTDRALLLSDNQSETFLLPALASNFLRRKRPEAVSSAGTRLVAQVKDLVMKYGGQKYDRFSRLESKWPAIAAALPILRQVDNQLLQTICQELEDFLDFSGRWDELLSNSQQAEQKAVEVSDFETAAWRAYCAGWVHFLRTEPVKILECAQRCGKHLKRLKTGEKRRSYLSRLRGNAFFLQEKYRASIEAYRQSIRLDRTLGILNEDLAIDLNCLAVAESAKGNKAAAIRHLREALKIAKQLNFKEGIATYTGNLAGLEREKGNWRVVETLVREALSVAEDVNRLQLIAINCSMLGEALARQSRWKDGLSYARRAVDLWKKLRMASELLHAEAILKECEAASKT